MRITLKKFDIDFERSKEEITSTNAFIELMTGTTVLGPHGKITIEEESKTARNTELESEKAYDSEQEEGNITSNQYKSETGVKGYWGLFKEDGL